MEHSPSVHTASRGEKLTEACSLGTQLHVGHGALPEASVPSATLMATLVLKPVADTH